MAPHRVYDSDDGKDVPPSPRAFADKQIEPIAIVGFSIGFPQDATTSEALWDIMMNQRNTATSIPTSRMNINSIYHPDANRRGQVPVQQSHFLQQDLAVFDAPFFATSTTDAAVLDPQQRLLLEHTYRALENAGISMDAVSGSRTSVFTGTFSTDWMHLAYKDGEQCVTTTALGIQPNFNANRISWFFNLHGNSANVDTACSSSLVSLDLGCQSLRSGDEDMSIVAGSNIILSPDNLHALTNLNMLSPDGQCFSFDHRANGYSRGEGIGVVILKRVSDAIRDNDTIRGIIRSTGCNQDGYTPSISLPNHLSQERLIKETYQKAGLSMEPTRFFEAHGTGTQVGDPTEARAIGSSFRHVRTAESPLWVGAIKSNIGHLEGASGIAGLIKTLLVLEKGVIPPNTNFEQVNPKIDTEFLRIKFPTNPLPWPAKGLRRASVNSFGNAGTNSHAILDDVFHFLQEHGLQASHVTVKDPPAAISLQHEYHSVVPKSIRTPQIRCDACLQQPKLLVFSANDTQGTQRLARSYASYHRKLLGRGQLGQDYVDNLVYTLSKRRSSLPWKSYAIVRSACELENLDKLISPAVKSIAHPNLAFIFTGQGAQWSGMACELMPYHDFNQSLLRSEALLKDLGCDWSLRDELFRTENSRILSAELSQPICTAIQIALTDFLRSLNIYPAAVVGHSSGEIAAAYCTGGVSHKSAIRIAYYRGLFAGSLAKSKVGRGAMMAVGLSCEDAVRYLANFAHLKSDSDLTIACINSPKNITVSGSLTHIVALQTLLRRDHVFARRLNVDVAYHSYHMQAIARQYGEELQGLDRGPYPPRHIAMFSSVTGRRIPDSEVVSADYWVSNLVSPVQFFDAIASLLAGSARKVRKKLDLSHRDLFQINMVIEVGPHSVLQGPINDTIAVLRDASHVTYSSLLIRKNPADLTILAALGQMKSMGYPVNIEKSNNLSSKLNGYIVLPDLPAYSFDHSTRYWDETRLSRQYRTSGQGKLDLLGKPTLDWNCLEPRWRNFLRASEMPWIEHHIINGAPIYPGAGMIVMAIEAANQLTASDTRIQGFELKEVAFLKPLKIPRDGPGIESQLVMHLARDDSMVLKSWAQWRIFCCENDTWSECSCGFIRARYARDRNEVDGDRESRDELQQARDLHKTIAQTCLTPLNIPKFYNNIHNSGLGVGPPFQRIRSGAINDSYQAAVEIELFKWPADQFPQAHVVHPATLDCMFHASFAGYTRGGDRQVPTMVPTFLDRLFVSKTGLSYPAAETLREVAWMSSSSGHRGSEINASALDMSMSQILLQVQGLRLTEIAEKRQESPHSNLLTDQFSYSIQYQPDPNLLEPKDFLTLCRRISSFKHSNLEIYLDLLSHKAAGLTILVVDTDIDHLTIPVLRSFHYTPASRHNINSRIKSVCVLSSSQAVLDNVNRELGEDPILTYQRTDVEAGFDNHDHTLGSYDIIIASKASHQRSVTLRNLHGLLKSQGKLFLRERIPPNGESKRQATERPEVDPFSNSGFGYTGISLDDVQTEESVMQRFFVYDSRKITTAQADFRTIYIIVNRQSRLQLQTADELNSSLKVQGLHDSHILSLHQAERGSIDPQAVYIVLLELDQPFLYSLDRPAYAAIHRLFTSVHDVMWISAAGGSEAGKPEYQMVTGFARALRSEYNRLQFTTIALQTSDIVSSLQIDHMLRVLEQNHLQARSGGEDVEFLEIDGNLQIGRLCPAFELTQEFKRRSTSHVTGESRIDSAPPLVLNIGSTGLLDTLHFTEDDNASKPLMADEVEIQVETIGVNFKDCLIALGRLDKATMGQECAGTIIRAGAASDFEIGDRVLLASTDVFRTVARCNAASAFKLPDNLSLAKAAAIPGQFATAWTVIHRLARLEKDETILIHVGASGTGQAAIQIAQHLGATIYTTVGSYKKKELLMKEYGIAEEHIFYSRDTSFVSGIKHATKSRGVDVIINSLAGDALLASWECLAPNGRFIEIGKKDIMSNSKLPMLIFEKMASFHAFDGDTWFREKQKTARTDMQHLISMFTAGILRPAQPMLVQDISEVENVFKTLQTGTLPGKHILEIRPDSRVQTLLRTKPSFQFNANATYVVAGGLGGIGRATTRFLALRGAKNLVLLSRYGPHTDEAFALLHELAEQGIQVQTPACDITDRGQVYQTFQELSATMPPIRGCVQATMLARDCIFKDMSFDTWREGIDCKVAGSWNLNSILPSGMEFFIMLSSASGLAGIKGQTNYDAANVYEDALARWRVARGEKAVAFDLGAMIEDGILAETPSLLSRVLAYGSLEPITRQKYFGMLDYYCNPALPLLSPGQAQVAVGLSIGGGEGLENYDHTRQPMLRPLERIHRASAPTGNDHGPGTRQLIASSTSLEDVVQIVARTVVRKLGKSLASMQDSSVDMDKPLQMHGVDSLLAIELRNWIVKEFEADLAVFETQGGASLNTLSMLIAGRTMIRHPAWSSGMG